ncbi:heparinase II/III family protein [Desulfocastanea catecholica]
MQKLRKLIRLYHTVKYLKISQILFRIWFLAYRPAVNQTPHPGRRAAPGLWVSPVSKPACLSVPWRFSFLNVSRDCSFPPDWNNPDIEKLWLYNLHYFDDLQCGEAVERRGLHRQLVLQWIDENPPGVGNGWEPYPTSLRIVNLVKWFLAGNECPEQLLQSLAVQARFLRKRLEYHLLGNHLFANGKALVFAGLFFDGPEAESWFVKGMRILEKEVAEQILQDGGHFERSPMYHAIILEDLLDLINIIAASGRSIPASWPGRAKQMLHWLTAMCHPDGEIALFNDAALAIAAEPYALQEYAGRLGIENSRGKTTGLLHLSESGYVRWQGQDTYVLMDVGEIGPDYLPGHAHADTLSFEMSLFGRRFIVDSGTSCYGLSEERLRQRGTLAHNTVSVEQMDSSEVWGGFRVAERATPLDLEICDNGAPVSVSCSHDGFGRLGLGNRIIHCRTWELDAERVCVQDTVTGGDCRSVVRFHFHPEVELLLDAQERGRAIFPDGQTVTIQFSGGEARLLESTYHPQFGLSVGNRCLQVSLTKGRCATVFSW